MTEPKPTEALLPCPFCGGKARRGIGTTHYIYCNRCRASSSVRAWNRRAAARSTEPTEAERQKAIEIAARKYHDAHVIDETEHASGCSVVQKKSDECDCGFDDLDVALSSAAARSPAPEWRPIDQAPKDGTEIDVWVPGDEGITDGCRHTDVKWCKPQHQCSDQYCDSCPEDRDEFAWRDALTGYVYSIGNPTHFMPLPSPPKETT